MTIFFWKITAPMAGVLSYACVRGESILSGISAWVRAANPSNITNSSSLVHERTAMPPASASRPQHYEISADRGFLGAVKLIGFGLYLVTTGVLQGAISIMSAVLRSSFLMMSLTALVAVLLVS
jgi:hypothetical protein